MNKANRIAEIDSVLRGAKEKAGFTNLQKLSTVAAEDALWELSTLVDERADLIKQIAAPFMGKDITLPGVMAACAKSDKVVDLIVVADVLEAVGRADSAMDLRAGIELIRATRKEAAAV